MAAANDSQMQHYCDERIRIRAERCRELINALRDDEAAIGACYDRAANGAPWADARTDGPPKLLASNDVLVYNTVAAMLLKCIDGTAVTGDVQTLSANWLAFQSACVHGLL